MCVNYIRATLSLGCVYDQTQQLFLQRNPPACKNLILRHNPLPCTVRFNMTSSSDLFHGRASPSNCRPSSKGFRSAGPSTHLKLMYQIVSNFFRMMSHLPDTNSQLISSVYLPSIRPPHKRDRPIQAAKV